ncbi:hypothetical protein [Nonomuraea dietziae]|uniref:hypothetical protein n=1 Tax=Nonomuraea dietziae TaxID=65515 RepID=UPI0031D1FF40
MRRGQLVLLVLAVLLAAAWLAPMAWAVATSLKPGARPRRALDVDRQRDHPRRLRPGARHRRHREVGDQLGGHDAGGHLHDRAAVGDGRLRVRPHELPRPAGPAGG